MKKKLTHPKLMKLETPIIFRQSSTDVWGNTASVKKRYLGHLLREAIVDWLASMGHRCWDLASRRPALLGPSYYDFRT